MLKFDPRLQSRQTAPYVGVFAFLFFYVAAATAMSVYASGQDIGHALASNWAWGIIAVAIPTWWSLMRVIGACRATAIWALLGVAVYALGKVFSTFMWPSTAPVSNTVEEMLTAFISLNCVALLIGTFVRRFFWKGFSGMRRDVGL
jgi:Na+-transporting methylmalonyl-CoA/oxaloacetate decarboxylase gamma subunit